MKLLTENGLCKSGSDARRLIQGSAVKINDAKVTDVSMMIKKENLKEDGTLLLQAGKKNFRKVIFQ